MLENIKIWRKIAPPVQLKPMLWKATRIFRSKVELDVINVLFKILFFRFMFYEFLINITTKNRKNTNPKIISMPNAKN